MTADDLTKILQDAGLCPESEPCEIAGWPCQREVQCSNAPEKWRGQTLDWRREYRDVELAYCTPSPDNRREPA